MSAIAALRIRHFTDPSCPYAFSAEPRLWRLRWLYGAAIEWEHTMVVLASSIEENERKGFTTSWLARSQRKLAHEHGMPIDWSERSRLGYSSPACQAVVAARRHAPERAEALLRRLRVDYWAGLGHLDEPELIARAAGEAGLDADELALQMEDEASVAALEADRIAARTPSSAARRLDHKLGGPAEERRYTCPSLEVSGPHGRRLDLPGFQPIEVYEAALANLAPELERRADPDSVGEVLEWAGEPLATAEVAMVAGMDRADARVELAAEGFPFRPVGADGYWSPA